jgi:hypothetical protein
VVALQATQHYLSDSLWCGKQHTAFAAWPNLLAALLPYLGQKRIHTATRTGAGIACCVCGLPSVPNEFWSTMLAMLFESVVPALGFFRAVCWTGKVFQPWVLLSCVAACSVCLR